jgi:hypothetical protein
VITTAIAIELFLKSIVGAVIKKGLKYLGLGPIVKAYEILTFFTDITSISTCHDLQVFGLEYAYDEVNRSAIDYLVKEIGEDKYDIERSPSGIYIANSKILKSPIQVFTPTQLETLILSNQRGDKILPTKRLGKQLNNELSNYHLNNKKLGG